MATTMKMATMLWSRKLKQYLKLAQQEMVI